jgi:adenosylcobinamide-phosphate synthase
MQSTQTTQATQAMQESAVWSSIVWDSLFIWAALSNRDLIAHAVGIERALRLPDLGLARQRLQQCVGRDTESLQAPSIRRATIEMVSESMVDGVAMPLFCLGLFGMPGLLIAKAVSTLDSMVGYRNERYAQYGWASARCDDVLNWLPARLFVGVLALVLCWWPIRAWQTLHTAWSWHALLPSPNSGWSEAAYAGALRVRLLGPIHARKVLVNEEFLGDAAWPTDPGSTGMQQCIALSIVVMLVLVLLTIFTLFMLKEWTWFG